MTRTLEEQERLNEQLFTAVQDANVRSIPRLIEEGANVNARDNIDTTPIYYCKNLEIARLLIKKGANVKVKDNSYMTPLHHCDDPKIAELLIKKGVDVNAVDIAGNTAFYFCSTPELAKVLIRGRANVNFQRKCDGLSLLHDFVYYSDHPEIAKLLIDSGANVDALNKIGYTPLGVCRSREMAKLLIDNGAETIDVTNTNEDINALIQSKATELLTDLTTLPNDISQLTTQQKSLITHLTARKIVGNPLVPREILNDKSLVDYMLEEKPNLLQFAEGYHEEEIFGKASYNRRNSPDYIFDIIKNNTYIFDIIRNNNYDPNIRDGSFLTNANPIKEQGRVFKQQQQQAATTIQSAIRGHLVKNELNKAKTAATKIQALGRGGIVRQRNIASTGRFTI